MFDEWSKYRVLQVFFHQPTTKHQLREISRKTDLGPPSVKKYLEELMKEGFVEKVEEGVYPGYQATMNEKFKSYKRTDTVRKIKDSGLLDYLENKLHPSAVVLYGSAAYGEDTEESDLDILTIAGKKKLNLERYEKDFKRNINIKFMEEEDITSNREFTNSLANGIVLKGFLKVKN